MEWEEDIFDNFIKLKRGYDLPKRMIVNGQYPVVASTSIKAFHNSYKVEPPCVVTGRSGSLGTVQYLDKKCWPLNTTLYAKDFKGNYPKYAYYFLQTLRLEYFNSGGAVPTLNQNHLHKLKVKIPPLPIQKKIAAVLTAYDGLIENNHRRIAILEKMAEEIFREWFVRKRFPGHEKVKFAKGVPEGWEPIKVKKIVNRMNFGRIYRENELTDIGRTIVIDQSIKEYLGFYDGEPEHIASINNPIILFGDHSCKMLLMIEPFSLAENVIPFKSKNNIPIIFLFYLVHSLIETTEYKRHWTELINKSVFLPDPKIQESYSDKVKELILEKNKLKKINQNLKRIRNMLLPRLLSGKLLVKELDIQFPASMAEVEDA